MNHRTLRTTSGIFAACVVLTASGALLQAWEPPGARSRTDFVKLHDLIRPSADESHSLWMTEIPWETVLWDAREKAAAEGKPILVVGTGGGSPLGQA